MAGQDKQEGLTRRNFFKVGIAGLTSTGLGAGKATAGPEQPEKAPPLARRKLGKTGVEVSTLALGGMFDTLNNQLLLRQARNWGVTYWDTAEGYGGGMSEDGFGRYFRRNPESRKEIFLVTKFRPNTPEVMTENLDKALKRLSTDYVDLFFIHGINDFGDIAEPRPFKEWAAQMKKSGKMKFFGFSTHANMEDCLTGASRVDWIDAVMFTYNFRLMHTEKMKEAVDACAKKGIGLVAMKTQGGGPVKTDSEAELQMAGRFLERGFTDKQAKIKAVLENPNIASVCSQMPSLTILSANVAAARDQTSISKGDFRLLRQFAAETREGYCAGCNKICHAAIDNVVPVSDVMRCLMYFHDYGDRDLARSVFAGLPRHAHKRITEVDYTDAERLCPQGLEIARLMEEASKILV